MVAQLKKAVGISNIHKQKQFENQSFWEKVILNKIRIDLNRSEALTPPYV